MARLIFFQATTWLILKARETDWRFKAGNGSSEILTKE
jgi:hypothetical protein